jgi:hypothetical protein
MVTPQQQELELAKAAAGKESDVINQITSNDRAYSDHSQDSSIEANSEHADFVLSLKKLLNLNAFRG